MTIGGTRQEEKRVENTVARKGRNEQILEAQKYDKQIAGDRQREHPSRQTQSM